MERHTSIGDPLNRLESPLGNMGRFLSRLLTYDHNGGYTNNEPMTIT